MHLPNTEVVGNIIESTGFVVNTNGFLLFFSLIITMGMFVGVRLDDGVKGLRRSLLVLLPFIVLQTLTNLSRIYQTSQETQVSFSAYNGVVTLTLTSVAYLIGLVIGHLIFKQAKKDALK